MSSIKPARRWQPAFYPFRRETTGRRILACTELIIKGSLFGCRMCGNCVLQKTAMICPMGCPKGMRNGPCGGVIESGNQGKGERENGGMGEGEKVEKGRMGGKCYIDETRNCVWDCIYRKAEKEGNEEMLLEILPPVDWSLAGTETWGGAFRNIRETGIMRFVSSFVTSDRKKKSEIRDSIFKPIRQPLWWKGDSEYHPPVYTEPVSELEKRLRKGEFVFTAEVTPPLGSAVTKLTEGLTRLKGNVAAVNFTDSSSACPRMSGISCCSVAVRNGIEPVLQVTARDNNRTKLQSDIMGINESGLFNVLCITGDSPVIGPAPVSNMNVFDLDSVQMLWILRRMRDEGIYLDGRTIKNPPKLFLGAASSPLSANPKLQAIRDQKKVNAGAQFIQTNLVFEPGKLDAWLEELDKRSLLEKVFILIGIVPLKSYKAAEWLNTRVPGVRLPDRILQRMQKAGEDGSGEGIRIALELIDEIKKKKGISGIHLVTLGQESAAKRIIAESIISW